VEPPEETQQATTGEADYYQVLGVAPTADAAAIDAAYQGRSLRFRVGQLRHRTQDLTGPTQEEIEHAYAILGNPESRTLYDTVYYPEKARQVPARRRLPPWIWAIAVAWVVAIAVVACIGVRSKQQSGDGAIGRIVSLTATAAAANGPSAGTATASPSLVAAAATPTAPAIVPAVISPTATATATPSTAAASPTTPPPTPTPTATVAPTATATIPPTASPTIVPTPLPPTPTPEPPPTATPEPPPPPPAFQPTDRIGVSVNVNLRNGPGTNYVSLGPLPPGTLLEATGETAVTNGQLWRRFMLEGGRAGWVRDVDVLPVR
jgi:hypothetical protein